MTDPDGGLLNRVLGALGGSSNVNWLVDHSTATLLMLLVWGSAGLGMLIFLAGLRGFRKSSTRWRGSTAPASSGASARSRSRFDARNHVPACVGPVRSGQRLDRTDPAVTRAAVRDRVDRAERDTFVNLYALQRIFGDGDFGYGAAIGGSSSCCCCSSPPSSSGAGASGSSTRGSSTGNDAGRCRGEGNSGTSAPPQTRGSEAACGVSAPSCGRRRARGRVPGPHHLGILGPAPRGTPGRQRTCYPEPCTRGQLSLRLVGPVLFLPLPPEHGRPHLPRDGTCGAHQCARRLRLRTHARPRPQRVLHLLLATTFIPFAVSFIPTFWVIVELGMYSTRWPWVIWGISGNAFLIFLFRQFYASFPSELDDAAAIDGAGHLRTFVQIYLRTRSARSRSRSSSSARAGGVSTSTRRSC